MRIPRPSLPPFARWPVGWRWLILGLAWAALTIAFFQPAIRVLDGDLDPSIFTSYAYFTAHGFQFGPEVVAMAGPYGFIMYGHFYGGDLFWLRLIGELAMEGVLAVLVLWFFFRQRPGSWLRWAWFPAHLLLTTLISDLPVAWIMLLAGLFLLEPERPARLWTVLVAAVLGWLALFKGTHLVLSLATIAVVAAAWGALRQWRHAALIIGTYFAALLGFWLLARQNPLHLPAYLAGTWHLATSYNDAMSLDEPAELFTRGAGVAGGLLIALGVTAWFRRREILTLGGLALLAGYGFVMWKHGFVRADGHVVIFFGFASVAVVAWCLHFVLRDTRIALLPRLGALTVAAGLLLTVFYGPAHPLRPSLLFLLKSAWPSFAYRISYLGHLPAERRKIEHGLQNARELNQLPETGDTIGRAPIDYFGNQQGIIPLNRFNYRPRPMGGGAFNVYDAYLMALNRDYLRDPARRPDFYLIRPGSIDERLVTQDDGLALPELLHDYRPELIEQNLLLMRAIPGARAPDAKPIAWQTFQFGEPITVPVVKENEMLLARFVVRNNWQGAVRRALYKSPPVFITLQDRSGARLGVRRLVPPMAASPFIFSPLIEDNEDLLGLYDTQPGRQPGSFTVTSPAARFFADRITVEFSALPRPPALAPYTLGGLRARLKFPYANAVPETITLPFKLHNVIRYLHAPSEIVWKLTGVERELIFHYGLDPRAYEEGTTNGVEFIVEVRGPSGGVTRAFSRLLRPLTVATDRGKQVARVQLPVYAPGSRLVLRTDPGEYGDNAWDWAYATRIDLRQGTFPAEQFPGFNRVPDLAEDEHAAAIEFEGGKAFLLHVPGKLGYSLTGKERSLTLDFGFLPGAYSAGGQTPGADYVVELGHAGQTREIFRRALRPVTEPADRGPQTARIPLPALSAGDQLILRTLPAPGASNSWGWTYVSRLILE
jgi:hypothetical protein